MFTIFIGYIFLKEVAEMMYVRVVILRGFLNWKKGLLGV
jgi:hypothetical protein